MKTFIILLVLFSLMVFPAYAQSPSPGASNLSTQLNSLSPQTMLASIEKTVPNLMRMITAFAYIIGFYMVISGVIKLKHVGGNCSSP